MNTEPRKSPWRDPKQLRSYSMTLSQLSKELVGQESGGSRAVFSKEQLESIKSGIRDNLGGEDDAEILDFLLFSAKVARFNNLMLRTHRLISRMVSETLELEMGVARGDLGRVRSSLDQYKRNELGDGEVLVKMLKIVYCLHVQNIRMDASLSRVVHWDAEESDLICDYIQSNSIFSDFVKDLGMVKEYFGRYLSNESESNMCDTVWGLVGEGLRQGKLDGAECAEGNEIQEESGGIQESQRGEEIKSENESNENDLGMQLQLLDFYLRNENICLVSGPEYSGKTFLVEQYIKQRTDFMKIVLDKSVEVKSLLGDYVISHEKEEMASQGQSKTEQGSEDTKDPKNRNKNLLVSSFRWQDGPLVHALRAGKLLVLEHFELATDEIKSFMRSFLEKRQINLKNETISVSLGFGLIIINSVNARQKNHQNSIANVIRRAHISLNFPTAASFMEVARSRWNFVTKNLKISLLFENLVLRFLTSHAAKLEYLGFRFELVYGRYLSQSSLNAFLSSKLKEMLLVDVLDVLFDGSIGGFVSQISESREIMDILQMNGRALNTIVQTYTADLTNSEEGIVSGKFEIQRFAERHLPEASEFEKFVEDYSKNLNLKSGTGNRLSGIEEGEGEFCLTQKYKNYIEKLMGNIQLREPVVLIGETGAGKTATIQYLAKICGRPLRVINLSKGTDSSDLFGGFRPVSLGNFFKLMIDELAHGLEMLGKAKNNTDFFANILNQFMAKNYTILAKLIIRAVISLSSILKNQRLNSGNENLGSVLSEITDKCRWFLSRQQHSGSQNFSSSSLFEFCKGVLWRAVERGEWLLLDEINLAPDAVLERLCQLPGASYLSLLDSNQARTVKVHPDFRLFAAMNPGHEVGKKALPARLKNRLVQMHFTPVSDRRQLIEIINRYFRELPKFNFEDFEKIAEFFCQMKILAEDMSISDLNSNKLTLSLRQLARACRLTCRISRNSFISCPSWKAIYSGLRVAFNSELNVDSQKKFDDLFEKLFGVNKVREKYLSSTFFYFRFKENKIENVASDLIGLFDSEKMRTGQLEEEADTPETMQISQISDGKWLLNVMGHPVMVNRPSQNFGIQEEDLVLNREVTCRNVFREHPAENEADLGRETTHRGSSRSYIITQKLKINIFDLLKTISFDSRLPVLLEGPTSTGKTSVVLFLAGLLNQKVLRVNNHKDTDLEEYIGRFVPSNQTGKLEFVDGVLTRAMKQGQWILLDELNLAKSEILEALNSFQFGVCGLYLVLIKRVLDDNQELYIPETDTTLRPAPGFRIFATQNPSSYSGRRLLSKAFRNRFVIMSFANLENSDISKILKLRCSLPESRAKRLLQVLEKLRYLRSSDSVLAGKEGLVTIRDLLKLGRRRIEGTVQDLASETFALLGERVRDVSQKRAVLAIIKESIFDKFEPEEYYERILRVTNGMGVPGFFGLEDFYAAGKEELVEGNAIGKVFGELNILRTSELDRCLALTLRALKSKEPVLLVGETGCGKTTMSQAIAQLLSIPFYSINCHKNTDVSDFLGSFRPIRDHSGCLEVVQAFMKRRFENVNFNSAQIYEIGSLLLVSAEKFTCCLQELGQEELIGLRGNLYNSASLEVRARISGVLSQTIGSDFVNVGGVEIRFAEFFGEREVLRKLMRLNKRFEWVNGSLIEAVKNGGVFLVDEISLASDNILERLNSLLESDRKIQLEEATQDFDRFQAFWDLLGISSHSGDSVTKDHTNLTAHPDFYLIGTMNPSGDFGKRELSPALRNRFTEIWCTAVTSHDSLSTAQGFQDFKNFTTNMVKTFLPQENFGIQFSTQVSRLIFDLFEFVNVTHFELLRPLSLRDLKSFLEITRSLWQDMGQDSLYGGFLLLFEATMGLASENIRRIASQTFKEDAMAHFIQTHELLPGAHVQFNKLSLGITKETVEINKLKIQRNCDEANMIEREKSSGPRGYVLDSQKILSNMIRIMMGLKSGKALLLEGPPGVGKTSLVTQLAKLVGKKVYRVNLNEQTDLIDLLGQDVPDPKRPGSFKWAPGVLARSLEDGDWLILDELNLASQTVLEGLNSVLDHRGSVYVSELGITLNKASGFQIFGCQNAKTAGNKGRKGLPLSFLNRFVRIYLTDINSADVKNVVKVLVDNLIEEVDTEPSQGAEEIVIEGEDETSSLKFDGVRYMRFEFEKLMGIILEQVDRQNIPAVTFNIRFFIRVLSLFKHFWTQIETGFLEDSIQVQMTQQCKLCMWNVFKFLIEPLVIRKYPEVHSALNVAFQQNWGSDLSVYRLNSQGQIQCGYDDFLEAKTTFPQLEERGKSPVICIRKLLIDQIMAQNNPEIGYRLKHYFGLMALFSMKDTPMLIVNEMSFGNEQMAQIGNPREIIQDIAVQNGRKVSIISLFKSADLADLIGGYSQKKRDETVFDLKNAVLKCLFQQTDRRENGSSEGVILEKLKELSNFLNANIQKRGNQFYPKVVQKIEEILEDMDKIEELQSSNFREDLQIKCESIKSGGVTFEWEDSALISGLERGDWVILENCELMSPSLLEKLNAILEDSEKIVLNECAQNSDGGVRVIHKNSGFKAFLIFNKQARKNLIISRPLLNRCAYIDWKTFFMKHEDNPKLSVYEANQKLLRLKSSLGGVFGRSNALTACMAEMGENEDNYSQIEFEELMFEIQAKTAEIERYSMHFRDSFGKSSENQTLVIGRVFERDISKLETQIKILFKKSFEKFELAKKMKNDKKYDFEMNNLLVSFLEGSGIVKRNKNESTFISEFLINMQNLMILFMNSNIQHKIPSQIEEIFSKCFEKFLGNQRALRIFKQIQNMFINSSFNQMGNLISRLIVCVFCLVSESDELLSLIELNLKDFAKSQISDGSGVLIPQTLVLEDTQNQDFYHILKQSLKFGLISSESQNKILLDSSNSDQSVMRILNDSLFSMKLGMLSMGEEGKSSRCVLADISQIIDNLFKQPGQGGVVSENENAIWRVIENVLTNEKQGFSAIDLKETKLLRQSLPLTFGTADQTNETTDSKMNLAEKFGILQKVLLKLNLKFEIRMEGIERNIYLTEDDSKNILGSFLLCSPDKERDWVYLLGNRQLIFQREAKGEKVIDETILQDFEVIGKMAQDSFARVKRLEVYRNVLDLLREDSGQAVSEKEESQLSNDKLEFLEKLKGISKFFGKKSDFIDCDNLSSHILSFFVENKKIEAISEIMNLLEETKRQKQTVIEFGLVRTLYELLRTAYSKLVSRDVDSQKKNKTPRWNEYLGLLFKFDQMMSAQKSNSETGEGQNNFEIRQMSEYLMKKMTEKSQGLEKILKIIQRICGLEMRLRELNLIENLSNLDIFDQSEGLSLTVLAPNREVNRDIQEMAEEFEKCVMDLKSELKWLKISKIDLSNFIRGKEEEENEQEKTDDISFSQKLLRVLSLFLRQKLLSENRVKKLKVLLNFLETPNSEIDQNSVAKIWITMNEFSLESMTNSEIFLFEQEISLLGWLMVLKISDHITHRQIHLTDLAVLMDQDLLSNKLFANKILNEDQNITPTVQNLKTEIEKQTLELSLCLDTTEAKRLSKTKTDSGRLQMLNDKIDQIATYEYDKKDRGKRNFRRDLEISQMFQTHLEDFGEMNDDMGEIGRNYMTRLERQNMVVDERDYDQDKKGLQELSKIKQGMVDREEHLGAGVTSLLAEYRVYAEAMWKSISLESLRPYFDGLWLESPKSTSKVQISFLKNISGRLSESFGQKINLDQAFLKYLSVRSSEWTRPEAACLHWKPRVADLISISGDQLRISPTSPMEGVRQWYMRNPSREIIQKEFALSEKTILSVPARRKIGLYNMSLQDKIVKSFDFYNSQIERGMLRDFISILETILQWSRKVGRERPDLDGLPVFISLKNLVAKIIRFDADCSYSKIATGSQILAEHLKDLESLVPKSFGLQEVQQKNIDFLVSLRKIEKNSWSSLLRIKQREIDLQDIPKCLTIKSLILEFQKACNSNSNMRDSSTHELASHIKNFLTNSPQSVFAARLLFLDSVLREMTICDPSTEPGSSNPLFTKTLQHLTAMLEHYLELLWSNESLRLAAQKRAQSPMKETNRILNWKFKNLINLQMNVERLYRGVARCLKLQQDFTGETVRQNLILRIEGAWREKSFDGFVRRVSQKVGGVSVDYEEEGGESDGASTNEEDLFDKPVRDEDFVGDELKRLEKNKKTDGEKYVIRKSGLLNLIEKAALTEEMNTAIVKNFRNFRIMSIRNMLKSLAMSQFHASPLDLLETKTEISKRIRLYQKIDKKRPVYKNYFRGKQCLKSYISQKMKGLERIKESKKSFKLRFIVDFVKGFRRLFDVTKTVNFHNLSLEKLMGLNQKSQISEQIRGLMCGVGMPEGMDLCHIVKRNEKMNRRGFDVLETMGYLLGNQPSFHDDLTPNSRSKVMGIVFWMYLQLQRQVMMSNRLIRAVSELYQKVENGKAGSSREDEICRVMGEFGIQISQSGREDGLETEHIEDETTMAEAWDTYMEQTHQNLQTYDRTMKQTDNVMKIEENWQKQSIQQIRQFIKNFEQTTIKLRSEKKTMLLMDLMAKVTHSIGWIYEMNKLTYVMSIGAKNLLMDGICQIDDDEDEEEGETQEEMWNEGGEGMGDGQGEEGVEGEMEFEEQLMGLQDEMENDDRDDEDDKENEEGKEDNDQQEGEANEDFEKEEDQRNAGDEENQETEEQAKDEGLDVGNDFGGEMEQGEEEEKPTEDDRMGTAEQENLDLELFEESGGEEDPEEEQEEEDQPLNETDKGFEKDKLEEEDKELEEKGEEEEEEQRKGDEMNAKANEEENQVEHEEGEEIEEEVEEHREDAEGDPEEEIHEEVELDFEGLEEEQVEAPEQEDVEDFGDEIFQDAEQELDLENENEENASENELEIEEAEEDQPQEEGQNGIDEEQPPQDEQENPDEGEGVDLDIQNEDQVNTQNTKGKGNNEKDLEKEKEKEENKNLEDILKEYGVEDEEIEKIKREEQEEEIRGQEEREEPEDPEEQGEGEDWEQDDTARDLMKSRKKEKNDEKNDKEDDRLDEKGEKKNQMEPENEDDEDQTKEPNAEEPDADLSKRSHDEFSGKANDPESENEKEVNPELGLISESRLNQYKKVKPNDAGTQENETQDPISGLWQDIRRMSPEISELFSEILEEQRSSEYQGDFRSGKKLSMRRIVGFIASDFRRDKIWLRKAEPEDRQYRVSIVLDNSLSMGLNRLGELTLRAGLVMCEGLLGAQVRRVNLIKLNDSLEMVRSWTCGQKINRLELNSILESFGFNFSDSESSNLAMPAFLRDLRQQLGIEWSPSVALTEETEMEAETRQRPEPQHKFEHLDSFSESDLEDIVIILSDGRMNKDLTRAELAKYGYNAPRMVFVVLDSAKHEESIISWRTTRVVTDGGRSRVQVTSYLEDFPFKYYVIASEMRSLAKLLGSVLSQCMSSAV